MARSRTPWPHAIVIAVLVLGLASVARAQATSGAFHEGERRAQLHDQQVAANVLYVASVVVGLYGIVGGGLSLGGLGGPECIPADSARCAQERLTFDALFYGGFAADGLAHVLFFVALGLDLDRRSRQRALDWARGRVRLVPGPGQLGLGLAFTLDR